VFIVHCIVSIIGLFVALFLPDTVAEKDFFPSEITKLCECIRDEFLCILGGVCAGAVVGGVATILCPMRWYNGGVMWAVLYFVPPIFFSVYWARGYVNSFRSHSTSVRRINVALGLWSSLLFICSCAGIMSGVMPLVLTVNILFSKYLVTSAKAEAALSLSMRKQVIYLVTMIPSILLMLQLLHTVLVMVIPLLGKTGTLAPADPILGALIGLLISLPAGAFMASSTVPPMKRLSVQYFIVVMACVVLFASIFLNSYSASRPKRLWVQHVYRERSAIDNTVVVDSGMWVSAFDSRGLAPFSNFAVTSGVDPATQNLFQLHNAPCNLATGGECYFNYPWYFPVADAIQDSVYIPTTKPPDLNGKNKLRLTLISKSQSNISSSRFPQRVIEVSVEGPSHMALVINDGSYGKRILRWDLSEGELSHQDTTSGDFDFPSSAGNNADKMVIPSLPRSEGIHYFQIGFGLCSSNICRKTIKLEVRGVEPVHVAAYGHYVDVDDSEISRFISKLPVWARGAEWTNFPSLLVSKYG
jgi:hypothetical protein